MLESRRNLPNARSGPDPRRFVTRRWGHVLGAVLLVPSVAGCFGNMCCIDPPAPTQPQVDHASSTDITLTPDRPVAVADVTVTIGAPPGATVTGTAVSLAVTGPRARVVAIDADSSTLPVFIAANVAQEFALGELEPDVLSFHRHVVVEAIDRSSLPISARLTIRASVASMFDSPVSDVPVRVSGDWTLAPPPAVTAAVSSGEIHLGTVRSTSATVDLALAPDRAVDPRQLVATWTMRAGFSREADREPNTANLLMSPCADGCNVTLFEVRVGGRWEPDTRTIFMPSTIQCSLVSVCDLHYKMTVDGGGAIGTVRWQMDVSLVDYAATFAPAGRSASIDISGVSSEARRLDPSLGP